MSVISELMSGQVHELIGLASSQVNRINEFTGWQTHVLTSRQADDPLRNLPYNNATGILNSEDACLFCGRKDNPCVHICSNQHAIFIALKHNLLSSCGVTAKLESCSLLAGIVFQLRCNPVPDDMEQGYILVIIQQEV